MSQLYGEDGIPCLDCGGRMLRLDRPRVVGIVNVTPDSFSDGGAHAETGAAIEHGLKLLEHGADMLDIGGESTRPGARDVDVDEEVRRVIPVIRGLSRQCSAPLSVDTSKPAVMRAAVEAGAGMINDVRALREAGSLEAAAELGVPVCLMHMQGQPRSMQSAPHYDDVVAQVHRFLAERVFACEMAGIDKRRVLVDPGFGFGKLLEHNLALLRAIAQFVDLAAGVYVGLSRKSMIGAITGRESPADRLAGSLAAALVAVQRGAVLVRAHDVAATVDALKVWKAVHDGDTGARPSDSPTSWPDED